MLLCGIVSHNLWSTSWGSKIRLEFRRRREAVDEVCSLPQLNAFTSQEQRRASKQVCIQQRQLSKSFLGEGERKFVDDASMIEKLDSRSRILELKE